MPAIECDGSESCTEPPMGVFKPEPPHKACRKELCWGCQGGVQRFEFGDKLHIRTISKLKQGEISLYRT